MSWGAHSEPQPDEGRNALETAHDTFVSEATAAGFLLVDLASPRAVVRGRLGLFIEGAIERALEARGAPPPRTAGNRERQGSLVDYLDRVRTSGARGLAMWVSSLEAIANASSVLDADDGNIIRWWIDVANEHPVLLAFDSRNQGLRVHLEPVALASILASAAERVSEEPSADSFDDENDGAPANEASALDDDVSERDDAEREPEPDSRMADSARAMADELGGDSETTWLREALMELSTPPPPPLSRERSERVVAVLPSLPNIDRPERAELVMTHGDLEPLTPVDFLAEESPLPLPPLSPSPRLELRFAEPEAAPTKFELNLEERRRLEGYARELQAASGPKPLTVVERLFAGAYVPLRAALDQGAELPSLAETANEWARSFERSYTDGFDALRMRTKRPTMVVDVPDIALRVARLHGARATQLLLVDGLRFDLGNAVNERLAAIVGKRAACAERFLLWSALPTTTGVQVELIGRGPAGLREPREGVNEEMVVARGRKASMVRRLKAGHREVLKLDVVAARLAEPSSVEPSNFDAIADEVASRIAAHFEGLQPRTLVMVFGDHGFAMERRDGRTTATEGGASPEEVLVPAFAWLVGAVH